MVEKLLTNWLSICLYAFLRVRGTMLPATNQGGTSLPCQHLRVACFSLPSTCLSYPKCLHWSPEPTPA